MAKKSMTEKVLMVLDGLIKETAAVMYPYKGIGKHFRKYEGSFSKAIYDINKRGYIEVVEDKNEKYLRLTQKGRLKLIVAEKLVNWDGLWRIIAFDVPESRKKTRDIFRLKLRQLNCQPVQKSVWLSPSDISTELESLLEILDLVDNVDYFISKAVTNDEKYKKMFKII